MDSDLDRTPPAAAASDAAVAAVRWRELLDRLGGDVALSLTAALERVQRLASSGRIERLDLRALRDELEAARGAGMIGQQLARLGAGRLRQSHERLQLAQTVAVVLAQREREAERRGVEIRPTLRPAEVIVDASLLVALLDAVLDWALAHARSPIELRLDTKPWPAVARLACRFARSSPDASTAAGAAALDSLTWRLIEQTAWAMGLRLERHDAPAQSGLTLEFPRTVGELIDGMEAVELDDGGDPSAPSSQPVVGSQVLVVAARRELRQQVREAIRHMGLIVDFVPSVAEAAAFCDGGPPHAVVYEAALGGERLEALRRRIREQAPDAAFIEIAEEGDGFETSGADGAAARVGRDAIRTTLPSALLLELTKAL